MSFIYDPRKKQNGYAVEPTVRPSYAPGVSPGLIDVGVAAGGSPTQNNSDSPQKPDTTKPETPGAEPGTSNYTTSDTVTQVDALIQQTLAQNSGAAPATWQSQLNDTINQILNREKFHYDLNGDALYQQYKDQYTTQGKMASMDAMGKAAAMTGGYGNSYAQSVGHQAYQGYLQDLNAEVPELYQLALDQYKQEGQDLYNRASLLAGMEQFYINNSGGGGTEGMTLEPGSDAYKEFKADIDGAKSLIELQGIAQKWVGLGYSKEVVEAMTAMKMKLLTHKQKAQNNAAGGGGIPITGPTQMVK